MKVLSFLFVMTIMLAQDCRNSNNSNNDPKEVMPVIKMVKNACFGRCPVYSLTIHNDGNVVYVGNSNTPKMGTFAKQIPTEDMAALLKEFDAINFWEMDEVYPSQMQDLPKTIITLMRKDTSKSVTGDHFRPQSLMALDKKLVDIADSKEGWTLTEKHKDAKALPDYFIKDEIITKFGPNVMIEQYIKDHEKYGMAIKKKVAPNLDLWIITYDTTTMDPSLMLRYMKNSVEVAEAEFNKELSPREH